MLGASGVLLGKFQNQWIMASSYHMCSQNVGGPCRPIMLRGSLRLLGIPFQGQEIIGYWPENDLMLFTVEFDASDEDKLVGVGQSFDFKSKLKSGSPLVAAGYTLINGFSGNLQINADSDCKILSQTGETRLIADPDSLRPDSEKKWAFAMGCDIARGDSGGPVIDKDTGKVVGLVWTAKNPTTAFARSSSNLEGLRQAHDARLWTEAAYATSSLKMSETLRRFINDPKVTDENHKSLVRALLEQ
jgi:S1-C subfamily serine protease